MAWTLPLDCKWWNGCPQPRIKGKIIGTNLRGYFNNYLRQIYKKFLLGGYLPWYKSGARSRADFMFCPLALRPWVGPICQHSVLANGHTIGGGEDDLLCKTFFLGYSDFLVFSIASIIIKFVWNFWSYLARKKYLHLNETTKPNMRYTIYLFRWPHLSLASLVPRPEFEPREMRLPSSQRKNIQSNIYKSNFEWKRMSEIRHKK